MVVQIELSSGLRKTVEWAISGVTLTITSVDWTTGANLYVAGIIIN
mgnify:FL=1